MHVGRDNPQAVYSMRGSNLAATEVERDIGEMIHRLLKPSVKCSEAARARQATIVLCQPSKAFHYYRDRQTLVVLYKQYVRPHLEFATPAWSPWLAQARRSWRKSRIEL